MAQRTRQITYSALMCATIIVSTLWLKFSIPGTDLLFTTQVFFVLLCGHLLSSRYCLFAIGTYLLLGLMGIPVFSATQGPGVIVTPSFGFLLGFPLSAVTVSIARSKLRVQRGSRVIASLLGILVLYIVALSYIAVLKGVYLSAPIPFPMLLTSYCLAFLPMDILKGILAAFLAAKLEKPLALRQHAGC